MRWAPWLAAGVLLRLRALPPAVADVDGVNFARGLLAFDPARQAPHFPGYGVYVGASKVAAGLGASEVLALALPGLALWVLGAWLFASAVRGPEPAPSRRGGVADLTLVALALLPGAALFGAWPTSDGFGLGLALVALGALGRALESGPDLQNRWALLAAFTGGLLLGVRLSWWPLVVAPALLALLVPGLARRAGLVALAAGGLATAAPLLVVLSPAAAAEGLLGFGAGHLGTWGGAAHSAAELPARVVALAVGGWRNLLGGWTANAGLAEAVVTATVAVALLGALRRRRGASTEATPLPARVRLAALATVAAYLAWLLVAQNVDKPRHLLPLVPLLALALAAGLARARTPAWALALVLALVALPRAAEQAKLAPAPALVQHVLQHHAPTGLQIFAGEEARVFEHLAPAYRVWRPATPAVLAEEAARAERAGALVLITSGALGVETLEGHLEEVTRARTPRAVRAHDHELVLYRYRASRRMHAHR